MYWRPHSASEVAPPHRKRWCGLLLRHLLPLLLLVGAVRVAPIRLPQSVELWDYFNGTLYAHNRPAHGRFWDREWLRQATATADAERIERVLHKLNAGQPIMVMAFGSSITAERGGVFEPRPGMLAALVPMPVHHQPNHRDGWLRMLMQQINTTWPHPDHLLYNVGQSGASILHEGGASCLEAKLPHAAVDLVIAEFIPRIALDAEDFSDRNAQPSTQALERLMWRLYAHFAALHHPPPAYIFLKPMATTFHDKSAWACPMKGCPGNCSVAFPGPFLEAGRDVAAEWRMEQRVHRIVEYYGQSSLSMRHLLTAAAATGAATAAAAATSSSLASAVLSSPVATSRSSNQTQYSTPFNYSAPDGHHAIPAVTVTACEMARRLYDDTVHPSVLGQMLFADLIVNLLADAEAHLLGSHSTLAPANTSRSSPPSVTVRDHIRITNTTPVPFPTPPSSARPAMPAVTLTPEGGLVWQMRCYGNLPSSVDEQVLVGNAVKDESGQPLSRRFGLHPLVMPTGHAGWTHVTSQAHVLKPGDTPKYKPGWVATSVGAQLHIQVDAIFPRHARSITASNASSAFPFSIRTPPFSIAAIKYLRSYQHMGTARVVCLPPCMCDPMDIDAHNKEPVSVAEEAQLHISRPTPKCLLQLTVLDNTTSPDGEHKFKLIQVVLMAPF